MRGFIYNNPQLAHEDDGFWTFNEGKPEPHAYWCVLKELKNEVVFMAPVWFDLMDNLSNSVIETCPVQMSDGALHMTIGVVLMAPVWFDLMDNLSNSVIETCPVQMSDGALHMTIGVGRCVRRGKEELTTEPVMFMNPEWAKKACKIVARMCRGD